MRFEQKIVPFLKKSLLGTFQKSIVKYKTLFEIFSEALEVIDVTFQDSIKPSGQLQEGKFYFSAKNHLYSCTVEVCVRPIVLASTYSLHFTGSVSNLKSCREECLILVID